MTIRNQDERWTRRVFLRVAGICGLGGLALPILSGCNGKEEAEELGSQPHNAIEAAKSAGDPCSDLSGLSEEELALRTTFKYEPLASDMAKSCVTCGFYTPGDGGSPCGTCDLMEGPFYAKGTCISWATG